MANHHEGSRVRDGVLTRVKPHPKRGGRGFVRGGRGIVALVRTDAELIPMLLGLSLVRMGISVRRREGLHSHRSVRARTRSTESRTG